MKYLNYPLFFSMMLFGIIITMNSSSWLSAWLGMELNIMGFLPMILIKKNSLIYEIIIKYFLISSVSSMIMIYFSFFYHKMWLFSYFNDFSLFILLALGVKLGSAPFHDWFISFMSGMNPQSAFWLMTTQKLPPLYLTNMCFSLNMLLFFIITSLIVGSLSGFHQSLIMKLLAYSSISHLSWMLICVSFMNSFWMIYFLIYFIMLIPIIFFVINTNFFFMNMMMNSISYNKFLFFISILSFSGFPPLFGFFPKLYIIMMLTQSQLYSIVMILIFSSMVNLYFYLRLAYNSMFSNSMNLPTMNSFSYFYSINWISIMAPILMLTL